MADTPQEDVIPRYALTLVDTWNTVNGPRGEQYLNVTIAADSLHDFMKPLPKDKQAGGAKTEVQAMFAWFAEQVEKADALPKTSKEGEETK